ncbi:MAG: cytochrome c-type biogenesis protein CcmF [Chloroflexi bacterium]|nr:MAG: cytochrome c-type biogenesis protein CcmF [Chloroflexota bacterium]
MAEFGSIAIRIALAMSIYSAVGSVLGARLGMPELVRSARYSIYLIALSLGAAIVALVVAFLSHDFEIRYVAEHSSRAMATVYTWVAFYAGNEGSLLFLAGVLALLSSIALWRAPRTMAFSLPYVNAIMAIVLAFFAILLVFLADPFAQLTFVPQDGQGVNPLLTHPGMFIHPPMLMTGLVAVTIPFAFALGVLVSGRVGDEWVDTGRVWALIAWAVLGSGLLLGAWWAYTILGWGGYWAWDPVENAGLMPFLGLTAFVHSIMVQKRRGMFRLWNIALINITFSLALFGMFINRGGPVPSVHSFGQSTLGWTFLIFLGLTILGSFVVYFVRMPRLRASRTIEATLSRESAFLVNNLLLLGVAFITLWGVIYPLISEIFLGRRVTVAEPFYNQVNGPLLLALIFLMGVGPLLPWRSASLSNIVRALRVPLITAGAVILLALALQIFNPLVLLSVGLLGLVSGGIAHEWVRGTMSRHKRGENYPLAFVRLIAANRPRYGGYIVHLAVVALALGIVGSSFYDKQRDVILAPGEVASIGEYQVEYITTDVIDEPEFVKFNTHFELFQNGESLGTMVSSRDFYPTFRMASTRPAILSGLIEDVYVSSTELLEDGSASFRLFVNPLVWWVWAAGPIMILGTLVSLWPERRKRREPAPRQGQGAGSEREAAD